MHRYIKALILLVCLFYTGCTASNIKYYSYTSAWYLVESEKHLLHGGHLISYGDYLFEFNITTYIEEEEHLGDPNFIPKPRITGYDTLSVYLISGKNRLFYEFDTFAVKTKLLKVGKWENKPSGQALNFFPDTSKNNFSFGPLKKEFAHNTNYFVSKVSDLNNPRNDSLSWEFILIKGKYFNSYFRICGTEFTDKKYCLVGYRFYDTFKREGQAFEIENLRPLNEKEIAICKNMVEIMKTTATDTVGNYKK